MPQPSLLALLLAACLHPHISHAAPDESRAPPLSAAEAAAKCEPYAALYANADADLSRWSGSGITLDLMQRTVEHYTTIGGQVCIA